MSLYHREDWATSVTALTVQAQHIKDMTAQAIARDAISQFQADAILTLFSAETVRADGPLRLLLGCVLLSLCKMYVAGTAAVCNSTCSHPANSVQVVPVAVCCFDGSRSTSK